MVTGFRHEAASRSRAAGLVAGCSLAALLVGTGAARAQTAAAAASATAPTLEQVVVTAQHRKELAKNVPFSITALSARKIDNLTADGEDIRVLSAQVPSLYIESSFGRIYPRFYIRGLGNSDYTYNAQQPVSVVYDDVPVENAVLKSFPMFDVSDVEVLRGPQGTLFGRNTPAGVVKVDSNKPTDQPMAYLDVSYGTYNSTNVTAVASGPLIPGKLDYRISVLEERRDNWVTNINQYSMYPRHLEGYQDFAARGQLLFTPNDTFDALLSVDGRDLDGTARLFRANIIEPGTNKLIPGFKIDEINTNGDNYQYLGSLGTHLTMNQDLGPVKLTSITAWEHGDTNSRGDVSGGNFYILPNGTPRPGDTQGGGFADETSDAIPALNQITQELRLATTDDGPYFNQGGIFLFHENLRVDSNDYTQDGIVDISLFQRQTTNSAGIFDSATYKITPDLIAGAGVRVSTDHKIYSVVCTLTCYAPPAAVKTTYTGPSYNVNLDYAVSPNVNVYGRVATGYLAPALDGRNVEYDFGPAGSAFTAARAETTTSFEVGLKSTFLDNRARFNFTAYRWGTNDLQLTAVGGQDNSTQLLNAKHAIGQGIEAEGELVPIDNLTLTGSASYNFTEIQDHHLVVAGCGDGCHVEDAGVPGEPGKFYINGNPLPNAPRWVIDATARYTVPLSDTTDVYALTDWSYRSDVNFFLYRAVEFTGQSLVQGGLRIGYEDHKNGFEIAGFVRNILDQVRITGAIDFDNLTGFVNDPRTFGVQARVKF